VYNVLVLANHGGSVSLLADAVDHAGMTSRVQADLDQPEYDETDSPDAVVLDLASLEPATARRFLGLCKDRRLPVLAAIPRDGVAQYDPALNPDELVVWPIAGDELALRVKKRCFGSMVPPGRRC
jgi:hypothetical protein